MNKEEQLYNPAFGELTDLDDDDMTPELQTEVYKYANNQSDLDMIRYPGLTELTDLDINS